MLNKLITNIKDSLSSKKKSDEMSENEEELIESNDEEEDSESEETSDDSSKKRSMIIKVIVVLGLAYFAIDEFVLKNNEQAAAPQVNINKKKKSKKIVDEQNGATAESKNAAPNPQAQTAGNPVDPNLVNPGKLSIDEKLPVANENVNVLDKNKINDVVTPDTTYEAKSEPENIAKEESLNSEATKLSIGETKKREKQIDSELDKLITGDVKKEEKPVIDLKDKIAVEDVYVEPPTYENQGRGLVYNCKEKFWTCVDKPAYVQCNKNMKYNKNNGKPSECAVVNVYGTVDDCVLIQKYNVSHGVSTDFCN